jgi:nucleoside 2-deoxyribosyltransferase
MRKMKQIYVAGPYTANDSWSLEKNIRSAEEISFQVFSLRAVAVCSHTISRYFFGTLNEEFWLEATMNMLSRCDAMVVVEGWKKSSGTLGEIKYAAENDIPIFYSVEELAEWLKEGDSKQQSRCQPKSVKDGP